MHSGKLVMLNSFADLREARLVKQKLEAAGIPAYISGEALALIGKNAGLPIKLEIAEEDLEHARLVMDPSFNPAAPIQPQTGATEDGSATLMIFYDPVEAEHTAQLLRAHGIRCALQGATSGFLSMLAPGLVNIQLVVQEEDIDRACDILGFANDPDEPGTSAHARPGESPRVLPSDALKGDTPAPSSTGPRNIKRSTQTVQPASEEAEVAPSPVPGELTELLARPAQEDDSKSSSFLWTVLLLLLALGFLVWGVTR